MNELKKMNNELMYLFFFLMMINDDYDYDE